jgi:hypothetical protein
MTWQDVLFGLDHGLLDRCAPVELGAELLTEDATNSTLLDLAGLSENEDARPYVEKLASAEIPETIELIRGKWLYMVLDWIYEHKDIYPDPLQAVEEAYADFNYPESIAGFVRYMPSEDPDLGSREQNEGRLYCKWERYIDECRAKYGV